MLTAGAAVGLALREQVLDAGRVPTGAWDWPVDAIVSPDGILTAPASAAAATDTTAAP